jgi:hypothetical protein
LGQDFCLTEAFEMAVPIGDIDTRTLYPATPFFFMRTALEISYDANAPAPELWLAFLDEVTAGKGDDGQPIARPGLVTLIREMMGYLLSSDKKFFISADSREAVRERFCA